MKALLSCFLFLYAQQAASGEETVIRVQTEEGISLEGMRFAACDEEGTVLNDANGEPVLLDVNENGDIVTDLKELQLVRMNAPPAGYYLSDEVYPVTDSTVFVQLSQILIRKPEESVQITYADESGNVIDPFIPEAGRTYAVHAETEEMVLYEDTQFTIPLYDPGGELEIPMLMQEYGHLAVTCTGEDGLPENTVFTVFTDQACTKRAYDIRNHRIKLPAKDGMAQTDLPAGTYWLKCSVKDKAFMTEKSVQKISIRNRTVTEAQQVIRKRKIRITVTDGKEKLEACSLQLMNEEGEEIPLQEKDGRAEAFAPKGSYTVCVKHVPEGYYCPEPLQFKSAGSAETEIEVQCIPIMIRVLSVDSGTGKAISGAALKAEDREWISSGDDEIHLRCSAPGKVKIETVQAEDHYICREDPEIELPSCAPDEILTAERSLIPYSDLIIRLPEKGTEVRVFTDEACTMPAQDVYAEAAAGIADADGKVILQMEDGTYYIRPSVSVITDPSCRKITICHADSREYEAVFENMSASLYISAEDETDGTQLSSAEMELLDETGNTLAAWTTDAERTLFILRRGAQYTLRISRMPAFYTGQREITFNADSDITVFLKPYSILHLEGEETGSAYALYEDEACTVFAHDIAGNELSTLKPSDAAALYDGEYTLKQVKSSEMHYPDDKVRKVTMSMHEQTEKEINLKEKPLSLQIACLDDEGRETEINADILLKEKMIASAEKNGVFTSIKLKKGNVYTVRITDDLPYCRFSEKEINVKITSKKSKNKAVFHMRRIGRLRFAVPAEAGIRGAFYTDSSCTQPAGDADGNPMIVIPEETDYVFDVLPGEYQFKEDECASGFYPESGPVQIICLPGEDTDVILEKEKIQVTVSHLYEDAFAEGIEVQLEDNAGNIIESWTSTSGPYDISSGELIPGESYIIRQTGESGYMPKTEEVRFTMPKEASGSLDVKVMETREEKNGFPARLFGSLSLSAAVCFLVKMRLKAHI